MLLDPAHPCRHPYSCCWYPCCSHISQAGHGGRVHGVKTQRILKTETSTKNKVQRTHGYTSTCSEYMGSIPAHAVDTWVVPYEGFLVLISSRQHTCTPCTCTLLNAYQYPSLVMTHDFVVQNNNFIVRNKIIFFLCMYVHVHAHGGQDRIIIYSTIRHSCLHIILQPQYS